MNPHNAPPRILRSAALAAALLALIAPAWAASPEPLAPAIQNVAQHPHGMLCKVGPKLVLMVAGEPREMGTAHGTLLAAQARFLTDRVVYAVGAADTVRTGTWFIDRMAEIERRAKPFVPERYWQECDALGAAAGVGSRDARYANLFPELFHCSGVAVCGKATVDGRVVHARVLDYMRDINLQSGAAVQVFQPAGRYAWMSHGYGGFIGTVTAMNEKGLAIGEMGGRGEGNWDGLPMTLLLREVMERAATVDEAIDIIRTSQRTCEYYYVISDRHRAMAALECRPDCCNVLRPGQGDPRLPPFPPDCVFVSAGDRATTLAKRIDAAYGKIDVPAMIEIIKRPVAMNSNLHDAVFSPETLEMWVADAGKNTPACDEPYTRVKLDDLLAHYRRQHKAE